MKKSNWREELDAPSAEKKTINEFVATTTGILSIAKGLGLGTALKTVVGTTTGKVAAGTLAGVAVGSAMKRKRGSSKSTPSNFKTITTKNPQ